jgi:hypothetical protein
MYVLVFENIRIVNFEDLTYGGFAPDFQNTVTQIFSHNPITKGQLWK